jgi:CubicO group peptidase (beta-lactamase class C family)
MKKFFAAFLCCSSLFAAAQVSRNFIGDSLDRYIDSALPRWNLPGLAVCIVKDGQVAWMKGYGFTQAGGSEKVDANTLFMIGSNTKAFTATALAMLAAEKKLSLDDKVQKWMPGFRLNNALAGKEIMLRDLLCHRLGFETFQGDFTYWTSNLSRKQVIEKMSKVKAVYDFRTTWGYCNAAFVTAGEVIPLAAGTPWESFLQTRIFTPLEMNRTLALSKDMAVATNKAFPHTVRDGELLKLPFPLIDNLAPAGSISSSVSDMSHWITMLLANGKWKNNTIVSPAAIEATRVPHSVMGRHSGFPFNVFNTGHYQLYGLGWVTGEYNGKEIISHTGGVNGFVSSVTLVPEMNLGIVILTNTDQNTLYESLKAEITDAYMQLPYREYDKLVSHYMQQQDEQAKKWIQEKKDSIEAPQPALLPFSAYAGRYTNDLYGYVDVRFEKNHLKIYFEHHPALVAELDWLGNHRFLCSFNDPVFGRKDIPFQVKNGKVEGFTLRLANFVEMTTYDFKKKGR